MTERRGGKLRFALQRRVFPIVSGKLPFFYCISTASALSTGCAQVLAHPHTYTHVHTRTHAHGEPATTWKIWNAPMHFHFLARVVRSALLRKRVKDKSRVMADSQTADLNDEAAYTECLSGSNPGRIFVGRPPVDYATLKKSEHSSRVGGFVPISTLPLRCHLSLASIKL